EGRLVQAFLNLIVHVARCLPEGGDHSIEVRAEEAPPRHVTVEVKDTGPGLAPPELAALFEPMFTAPSARDLGLVIVKRIIEGFAGRVEVESELGQGTVFRLLLRKAAATAPPPRVTARSAQPGRRARILVVDDELPMCKSIARLLGAEHDVRFTTNA